MFQSDMWQYAELLYRSTHSMSRDPLFALAMTKASCHLHFFIIYAVACLLYYTQCFPFVAIALWKNDNDQFPHFSSASVLSFRL